MTKGTKLTSNITISAFVRSRSKNALSFILDNKPLFAKATILIICAGVFYYPDLSVVFSNALKFTTGNIANYTIIVPFLSAFIIYRKRKILQAVGYSVKRQSYAYPGIKLDDIVGLTLCTVAIIAYISSSSTLYALEYHLMTLPLFLAGGVAILFNLATLRHSIVAILLIIYLQPPPGELVSELAADLSWASAVLNHALLSRFGMPIDLDPSFGAPALVITTQDGLKTPFFVGEPSSGVFSTISLSLFAIFVSYIIRGKIWKRIILFLVGFPIFFLLNTLRIAFVITLWYLWGHDVSEAYHSVSGALMVIIGTISILYLGEKALKLNLGSVRSKIGKCTLCDGIQSGQFCEFCGRLTSYLKHRSYHGDAERIVLVVFLSFIVISVTALKAQASDTSKNGLSKLDISLIKGRETTPYFFPSLENWQLNYAYRDSNIESILNQDASLAYRIVPKNITAIVATIGGSRETISATAVSNTVLFSSIQISTGHHMWEDSLVTAPSRIGRPGATILETGEITINDDTRGHFLLFKRQGSQNTEAVIEWFERGPLKFGSHFENRNILISIWSTSDSLAKNGLIEDPADSKKIKQLYLSIAKPTAVYWSKQINGVTGGEDLLYTFFNHNGFFISSLVVFTFAIFCASYQRKKEGISSRSYHMYNQLIAEDKAFIDTLIPAVNKQKYHTGESISRAYEQISGKRVSGTETVEKLMTSERIGLLQTKIESENDQPLLVWRPLFKFSKGKINKFLIRELLAKSFHRHSQE